MMMRMIRSGLGLAALLMAPVVAQAADLPRPSYKSPVYVEPAFSWTGFYVGANAGYMWGQSKWSGGQNFEITPSGWLAGGTIGYNYQIGVWVWGIEGDVDYAALKGTNESAACSGCLVKDTWMSTVRGRVGYSMNQFLPYLTGGLAYGNVYMQGPAGGSEDKTRAGWTAGAGVEWAFSRAWSTKLEYLYVDLGDVTCGQANCGNLADTTVNFKSSIVRVGLNYRF